MRIIRIKGYQDSITCIINQLNVHGSGSDARERRRRKRKIRRGTSIHIIYTPPTPEKKFREKPEESPPKKIVRIKDTEEKNMENQTGSSGPGTSVEPERFRSLRGDDLSKMRRASHAGFDSRRIVELARRPSMPATLVMRDESARKLHTSSACVNLIQDFHSMKVVSKGKPDSAHHYLDEELQNILRRLKKTASTQVGPSPGDHDEEFVPEDSGVKKSVSDENMNPEGTKGKEKKRTARRTSSDTELRGVDLEGGCSDEEDE